MAATVTGSSTTLKLMVETGINKDGSSILAARSVPNINPALTNDDAYDIGKDLASLQQHPLDYVQRVNAISLREG